MGVYDHRPATDRRGRGVLTNHPISRLQKRPSFPAEHGVNDARPARRCGDYIGPGLASERSPMGRTFHITGAPAATEAITPPRQLRGSVAAGAAAVAARRRAGLCQWRSVLPSGTRQHRAAMAAAERQQNGNAAPTPLLPRNGFHYRPTNLHGMCLS